MTRTSTSTALCNICTAAHYVYDKPCSVCWCVCLRRCTCSSCLLDMGRPEGVNIYTIMHASRAPGTPVCTAHELPHRTQIVKHGPTALPGFLCGGRQAVRSSEQRPQPVRPCLQFSLWHYRDRALGASPWPIEIQRSWQPAGHLVPASFAAHSTHTRTQKHTHTHSSLKGKTEWRSAKHIKGNIVCMFHVFSPHREEMQRHLHPRPTRIPGCLQGAHCQGTTRCACIMLCGACVCTCVLGCVQRLARHAHIRT